MTHTYDFAVVGAGIVGLATAFALKKRFPRASVAVVEKEQAPARHQTGRNSGVIHSGIYYAPGSYKARNCIRGYGLLLNFLKREKLPHRLDGKLIVATRKEEIPRLRALYERGLANGLDRIRWFEPADIARREPHIRGIAAVYVPYTGVTDFGAVARRLADILQRHGTDFYFERPVHRVVAGNPVRLLTPQGTLEAGRVAVAAGLQTDRLYGSDEFRIIPFRGEYYYLRSPWAEKVRALVYPVPDPRYPFLGVHLTRHIDGRVSAGPGAVLACGREAYTRGGFQWRDCRDTLAFPGFWKMALRHWRTGIREMGRSLFKPLFARAVRRFLPGFPARALFGYHSGIRAQLTDRRGQLVDDFVIRRREH
ncbi:MAG: L-2-hydroxyglutarate oxidase, partial [Chlorobi bacterium]|nr:L-2-hydroxyglutarate oxidase [Chlorobiota bacterium]